MEQSDTKNTVEKKAAASSAADAASPTGSAQDQPASKNSETSSEPTSTRPSAIERQITATSDSGAPPGYDPVPPLVAKRTAADRRVDRRKSNAYAERRSDPPRFGLASFLLLFLLVAAGAAFVFSDYGRPLQNAVSTAVARLQQLAATPDPAPIAGTAPATTPAITQSPAATAVPITPPPSPVSGPSPVAEPSVANPLPTAPAPTDNSASTPAPQTVGPSKDPALATSSAISLPIADISLRNRPELLEQLVQVYKSQLADAQNNAAALAALNRLEERSLAELETIVAEGNDDISVRSLAAIARIFPELAATARYKYLAAQTTYPQRAASTQPATPSAAATVPAPPPATVSQAPVAAVKGVATPMASASASAAKNSDSVVSSKPNIRVVSMTPGAMVDGRFMPGNEGRTFMVEINYRNFSRADDGSEKTLIALLGAPGNSTVLAEAPVDILGDRGTKSFYMETFVPGSIGERYRLNFLLDDKFITSSTVRLSLPEQ